MEEISELANYIIKEIEKEDFYYAMRHYGCFRAKTTAKQILEWCDS